MEWICTFQAFRLRQSAACKNYNKKSSEDNEAAARAPARRDFLAASRWVWDSLSAEPQSEPWRAPGRSVTGQTSVQKMPRPVRLPLQQKELVSEIPCFISFSTHPLVCMLPRACPAALVWYHSVDQSPGRFISQGWGCCCCGFSTQPWLRQLGSPWEHTRAVVVVEGTAPGAG